MKRSSMYGVLSLVVGASLSFGCAGPTGAANAEANTAASAVANAGNTAQAAAKLGIKEELVQVAVTTARSYFSNLTGGSSQATTGTSSNGTGAPANGTGAPANGTGAPSNGTQQAAADVNQMATQKEDAAKQGVQAAADRAKQQGQELTDPQKSGLTDFLKKIL